MTPTLLSPEEAVRRLNTVLAHAWMVRTFLKHAEEIQHSEQMREVPRTLYDGIRAVEPAYQRGDWADYLRRLRGKLPKFRRVAEYFAAHFRHFSPHTNFEMAAVSLLGVVERMEEIFAATDWDAVRALPPVPRPVMSTGPSEPPSPAGTPDPVDPADPLDDLEIPEV